MKALIPVAGLGTRLLPHTNRYQKTLLPVAGKPVIDHIVPPILAAGIEEITFVIGHLGQQVVHHMESYNGRFNFVVQHEKIGLGHAILQGLTDEDTPVLVQLGDTIFHIDLATMIHSDVNQIAVGAVEDPSRFGIVELEDDRIVRFHEKVANPPSNLAITGLYYFTSQRKLKAAIEHLVERDLRTKGEYQVTDAMELMVAAGEPFRAVIIDTWYDVGVPETFLETNRQLLKSEHESFPGVIFHEPVYIARGCHLKDSTIGPYVTIMEQCNIQNCTIKDSIVLKDSTLVDRQIEGKIVGADGSQWC
ncbi:MAG: sugar phosphate nucleotidyltransferase [Fidelibacterota bacterium]